METFEEAPIPVVYPMHPRTKKRLQQNKFNKETEKMENVQILPPLGYLDFLVLMRKCEMLITDSGGIQEEATAPCIRKPVLVIRLFTERPEAVKAGFAELVGVEKQNILAAIIRTLENRKKLPETSPYGDGKAAEKIARIIKKEIIFGCFL
jgi:UDP-N-acetylglucosamine 2-epimerase (non-hydrolysing)